jgi:hypothetical protein
VSLETKSVSAPRDVRVGSAHIRRATGDEGVVWLTSDGTAHATVHRLAVVAFLGFALIVWPMWLPFSLLLIERSPARSKALAGLFWLGVAAAATAVVLLTRYQPVAVITGHSIRYNRAGHTTGWLEALVLLAISRRRYFPFRVDRTVGARDWHCAHAVACPHGLDRTHGSYVAMVFFRGDSQWPNLCRDWSFGVRESRSSARGVYPEERSDVGLASMAIDERLLISELFDRIQLRFQADVLRKRGHGAASTARALSG